MLNLYVLPCTELPNYMLYFENTSIAAQFYKKISVTFATFLNHETPKTENEHLQVKRVYLLNKTKKVIYSEATHELKRRNM